MAINGMHQIGEVADAVGLSLRTIRHYDDVGLVPPSGRSTGGFRLYTDTDIERLRLAKAMKPLELTLEEMSELLDARDRLADPATPPDDRALLRVRMAEFSALADKRCERLREQLVSVEGLARTLHAETAAG